MVAAAARSFAAGGAGAAVVASAAKCMAYFFSEDSMFRFCRFLKNNLLKAAIVFVAIGVSLGAPKVAQADFQFSWSADSGFISSVTGNSTQLVFSDAVPVSPPTIPATYTYTISGSASPNGGPFGVGTPTAAGMDLSTIAIIANGPGTVTLALTQNNLPSPYTTPTGVGTLLATLSGHFINGSGNVSLVAYGNDTNLLYGYGPGQNAPPPPTGGLTNVMTTAATGSGTAGVVVNGTTGGLSGTLTGSATFNAASSYSITEILTINFTTAGQVDLSSDGSAQFSSAPAPAGLLLALSCSPVLGLGYFLRRIKAYRRVA